MRIALVAGEASGDILGAGLVAAIRARVPDAEFRGVAGPRMAAAGVHPLFHADELSVIGLVEVLGRLPRLLRLRRALVADLVTWRPDVFVGIDSPDFNLPVARRLRDAGIITVQYVSPTVWAWRPARVRPIARAVHAVLCLFPFEPPHYAGSGTRAEFVGHPLASLLAPLGADARVELRRQVGLDPARPVLAVAPGSRASEVRALGPRFAETIRLLAARDLQFVAPMVSDAIAEEFANLCERHAPGVPVKFVRRGSRDALAAADVVLAKSGTTTLEALLLDRPMVVAYRVAPLTAWLLRAFRMLKTDRYALPNILAGRDVVPELIQQHATPEALATAVGALLDRPDAVAAQQRAFAALRGVLATDADARAADVVLSLG